MKLKWKLQIAQEENIKHKGLYYIGVLMLTAFMLLIPLLVVMRESVRHRYNNLSNGLRGSFRDVVQVVKDGETEGVPGIELSGIKGIRGYGSLPGQEFNYFPEKVFPEVVEYVKNTPSLLHLFDQNEKISPITVSTTMWDAMDIRLREGSSPLEMASRYSDSDGAYKQTFYLYFGSNVTLQLPIGTERVRVSGSSKGTIRFRYIVAGYLKEGSRAFSEAGDDFYQEWDTSVLLDNEIIFSVSPDMRDSVYVVSDGTVSRESLERAIIEENGAVRFFWIEDSFAEFEREYNSYCKIFREMVIIITVTGSLLLSLSQIIFLLSNARDYGILYSCGMSTREFTEILFLQNARRFFLPLVIGHLASWGIVARFSGHNPFTAYSAAECRVVILHAYPVMLFAAMFFVLLVAVFPAILVAKHMPVDLLNNDIGRKG